jgi:hypothetical protein
LFLLDEIVATPNQSPCRHLTFTLEAINMYSTSRFKPPAAGACASLFAASLLAASAFAQAPPSTPAFQTPTQGQSDSAKINAFAHRILGEGFKINSLQGDDIKPWHLKAQYQILEEGVPKPVPGTIEEWYQGPYQWKRAYQSPEAQLTGAEWSVSRTSHYHAKPKTEDGFDASRLHLRIAGPVASPLHLAGYMKPEYELDAKRLTLSGVVLTCISVADPGRYAQPDNPDFVLPTMCFDPDTHLRVVIAGDTTIQYDDIQMFQDRSVARDVKVMVHGQLNAEIKVSTLEPMATSDADLVKPPSNAIAEPFTIEPGFPVPESVFEVGASIPIPPEGFPFRGIVNVPVILQKDGSVKINHDAPKGWVREEVVDAVDRAVVKWKYKPYLLDGQPIEVGMTIQYVVDGKPFVQSYNRPKSALPRTPGPTPTTSPASASPWMARN